MIQKLLNGRAVVEDLLHGQVVIVVARWILVLAGLILAMWNPASLMELRIEILVLLCLAVVNFYLHLHLIVKRHSQPLIVYAASAVDLGIVTLLIVVQGGYDSNLYIFYFPAVLGYALSFPRVLTAIYTAGAIIAYAFIGATTVHRTAGLQELVVRMIMLAAIAACGSLYVGIESERREEHLQVSPGTRAMQFSDAHESGVS